MTYSSGTNIKDITHNPGILPILLGPARLITSQHTLIHHYKINSLIDEFHLLTSQYQQLLKKITVNNYQIQRTDEYCRLINYTINIIQEKINHVNINPSRHKRSLVNGLGRIIKFITGNLDAYDGERYEKIFSHIKENELNVNNQLKEHFSVISELISNFNSTVQDIRFNNEQIKFKLMEIDNFMKTYSNKALSDSIIETLSLQQLVFDLILSMFQDIENSITFCKLGTLHPSIIGTHQLLEELTKLSTFYNSKLPLENILDIEPTIKVTCAIHEDEIIYFLKVPLSDQLEYSLYYLRPVPTLRLDEYVTIFPSVNYLLKSNVSVIPLSDNCNLGNLIHCNKKLISNQNAKCETEILKSESTKQCQYTNVKFEDNWIEQIPESNQHLAIFPFGDKIEIHNKLSSEISELKGIFLISRDNNEIFYKGQSLHSESHSPGQPKLISNLKFEILDHQLTNVSLTLKELNLRNVNLNQLKRLEPLEPLDLSLFFTPSIWTILLYLLIVAFVSYTTIMYCKHANVKV
uniref:Envelope fusion protein n=2 Tax=Lygus hesperus TaxID=30085 RepID=A0A146L7F0_LYGHE